MDDFPWGILIGGFVIIVVLVFGLSALSMEVQAMH